MATDILRKDISPLEVSGPVGYLLSMDAPLQTVIETHNYLRRAAKLLTEKERTEIVDHLAANPTAGELIVGGGGVRKFRWSAPGRGKSGGVRVVHFFADERFPVFVLDLFAKNEKANYTQAELAVVREIAKQLKGSYARRA